jgi:ParB family chromosome partitioning protein
MPAQDYLLEYVSIYHIVPSTHQPRQYFEEAELESLAQSIRSVGLIQPLVAIKKGDSEYELIAGERRWRAALRAGLESVPVILRGSVHESASLIENIQRVDLNPMEIAQALQKLVISSGLTQEKLAEKIGKKRPTVANYLRLLSLPANIQKGVENEKISMGHAKALLSVSDEEKQQLLYQAIVKGKMTVRQAEEAASGQNQKDCFLDDIAARLQKQFLTAVRLRKKSGQSGEIVIDYSDWDELDRLLALLIS